jgi:hypothetical protein
MGKEVKEPKYLKDKDAMIIIRTNPAKKAKFKEAVGDMSASFNEHMDYAINKAKKK